MRRIRLAVATIALGVRADELGDCRLRWSDSQRRASWRELPASAMAAHLLATRTITDRPWTDEPCLPRETRTAFIRWVLLGETS